MSSYRACDLPAGVENPFEFNLKHEALPRSMPEGSVIEDGRPASRAEGMLPAPRQPAS